jgi:hypothetical protein
LMQLSPTTKVMSHGPLAAVCGYVESGFSLSRRALRARDASNIHL